MTSGASMASITRDAGSPFSSSVVMAFIYFLMWRKNFRYPAHK